MYLSYVGLRVRDLGKSIRFYRDAFSLEVVSPADWAGLTGEKAAAALLRDPRSGQRIELNYYQPGNPYAVPYVAGEELDHLAFRVDDLEQTLTRLDHMGYPYEAMKHYEGRWLAAPEFRVAYLRDPDGVQLELYDANGGPSPTYAPDAY